MKKTYLLSIILSIVLAIPAFAKYKESDLAPIATEAALILGGTYSPHLDTLERFLRSDGVALPTAERERCLKVIAALKKDVHQHIETANTIKKSVTYYGKSELVAQAFNLHVILSQAAYSALTMEQVIIEAVSDSKWRLQFKKDKSRVHMMILDHQEKCYNYAVGIL